jgi:hypothetical protein
MSASVIGLDTAKNVFQVHGVDERGHFPSFAGLAT